MSPGPGALLSAMSCDTVGLCGNCDKHGGLESGPKYEAKQCRDIARQRLRGMQLGAKRAVDARATLLLGRGWCKTQNAHEARPRPSFRGQKAVAHVVWTQIPSTVLPPGQMAKCENCDMSTGSVSNLPSRFVSPKLGLKK